MVEVLEMMPIMVGVGVGVILVEVEVLGPQIAQRVGGDLPTPIPLLLHLPVQLCTRDRQQHEQQEGQGQ